MQRNRPLILGAAIFGILAIGLTLMSLLGRRAPAPAPAATPAPVAAKQLVAARTIPPRTVVTADMVREDMVEGAATVGGLTSRSDVLGRLTGETIVAGAVFTPTSLVVPVKRATPASFSVPPGMRAVAVMVDPNSTVGGIVDVGDRVDIVVVHKVKYKNEANMEGESRSGRTIGQNLLVLATDAALKQAAAPPPPAPGAVAPAPTPAPPPPPPPAPGAPTPKVRVLVAAPPDVAERLAAAQAMGEIHMTLRDGTSRDAIPVPEAFEYPIRTVGRTAPNPGATGGGSNVQRTSRETTSISRETLMPPQSSVPMTPPMPPQTITVPAPGGAANNVEAAAEVTVIRGTEKTKVVVPQR